MKLLNLGCGNRYCPDWVNIDFATDSKAVLSHNLLQRFPFDNNEFELVYSSHLIEHFCPSDARRFLGECHRVMRSGGILRIVVPDLEKVVRGYLVAFEACDSDPHSVALHDWSIIQLIDQCTRDEPGGEMVKFLNEVDLAHGDAIALTSMTAKEAISARQESVSKNTVGPVSSTFSHSSERKDVGWMVRLGFKLRSLIQVKNRTEFNDCGEKHKWMYDRKSLPRLLMRCGFRECEIVNPTLSRYPQWAKFHLDSGPDGSVYRPDSLYIEAIK
jgi:predicted SAM-dependent methyltransferase